MDSIIKITRKVMLGGALMLNRNAFPILEFDLNKKAKIEPRSMIEKNKCQRLV